MLEPRRRWVRVHAAASVPPEPLFFLSQSPLSDRNSNSMLRSRSITRLTRCRRSTPRIPWSRNLTSTGIIEGESLEPGPPIEICTKSTGQRAIWCYLTAGLPRLLRRLNQILSSPECFFMGVRHDC